LAGAVEIARTEPGSAAEALDIAAEAAAGLAARLRLLRAAWAGAGEALDIAALRALCAGLPRHVWVDLEGVLADRCFPAASAQVLLNILLLAAESLPKGGVVMLGEAGPDAVLVVPRGQNAAWPPGFAAWMADPAPAWRAIASAAPRRLQGPLTALLAHAAGTRMSFALAADAEAAPPLLLRFA
jgi:histidine phosphotransferase ChpT